MPAYTPRHVGLDPNTQSFYCQALTVLCESDIPFLVGGAYALAYYTGIVRHTKDFDIFVRPADFLHVLDVCSAAGYPTEITFPSWLGKVLWESDTIDVIFSSGNGVARVDEEWFAHASAGESARCRSERTPLTLSGSFPASRPASRPPAAPSQRRAVNSCCSTR